MHISNSVFLKDAPKKKHILRHHTIATYTESHIIDSKIQLWNYAYIHIDFGEGGGNPYFGDLNSYKIFLEIGTIFFCFKDFK